MTGATLPALDERTRSCLDRYVELLRRELGESLVEIQLFGSAARGEEWPAGMPIRSDVDLLVLTEERLPDEHVERLVNETYPFFLEAGRQLAPQFRTPEQLENPRDEGAAAFHENVRCDAIVLWSRP
jgi:predicted nucleotidyltransferase